MERKEEQIERTVKNGGSKLSDVVMSTVSIDDKEVTE